MWMEYRNHAAKGFRNKLQFEFPHRWWEMYLTLGILHLGFPVSTFRADNGPDLLLEFGDLRVWVEAVAPKPGTASDAVPVPVVNGVAELPMRECLLRLTQTMTDKRDKLRNYMKRGIISKGDCTLIAMSACALNQFGPLLDWPFPVMLRVLAGADNLTIPLDKSSESFSIRTEAITRDSGSKVELALFYCEEFSSISGVLYSDEDPFNAPMVAEDSFQLFINPKAKVRVPKGITTKITTWRQSPITTGEGVEWIKIPSQ